MWIPTPVSRWKTEVKEGSKLFLCGRQWSEVKNLWYSAVDLWILWRISWVAFLFTYTTFSQGLRIMLRSTSRIRIKQASVTFKFHLTIINSVRVSHEEELCLTGEGHQRMLPLWSLTTFDVCFPSASPQCTWLSDLFLWFHDCTDEAVFCLLRFTVQGFCWHSFSGAKKKKKRKPRGV